MSPELLHDEPELRQALAHAALREVPPRTNHADTLDRIVISGRRRRTIKRTSAAVGLGCALAVVGGFAWSTLPPTNTTNASDTPSASSTSTRPTASSVPSTSAQTTPTVVANESSGVANGDWPTLASLTAIANRVAATGGGTVTHTQTDEAYYGLPTKSDEKGNGVWPPGAPIKSRSVSTSVQTTKGDYLVNIEVDGNPKNLTPYWDPSFDLCASATNGTCQTLARQADRSVFAYRNQAFPERTTMDAWIWRSDTLLMHVTVLNYGVETSGAKLPAGPDWKALGLTATDLFNAAG